MDIAKFLRIAFVYNTSGGCFWQFYHGTVKSAGVLVLWFSASTCFQFWLKTFTKCCTNNSLLSLGKMKNINCFRFWSKTYPERCTNINYVIHVSKYFFPLHFAVSLVLSIPGYDLGNGRILCKQKYCIKNMAVKISILILFCFCLLCWFKIHLFCIMSLL